MYRWSRVDFPSRFQRMRVVWAAVAALVGALLFIPVVNTGQCGTGGDFDCTSIDRSALLIPTTGFAWMIAAPVFAIAIWFIYSRRHD